MTSVYILGSNNDFRGNRWRFDVRDSAERLGWNVAYREAQGADPEEVVREASQADLFLWLRANMCDPAGDPYGMLRRIEEHAPTVGMHMDLYWTIANREPLVNPVENPWFSCQYVFTADGGNEDRFAYAGINHIWMPPAFGDMHFGLSPISRGGLTRPYAFVGTCSGYIHGGHRKSLLYWATNRYGKRFGHYGVNSRIHSEKLNQLYAKTRVVLGDSAPGDFYWSDRIPTTMGRGGVLAHPNTAGLREQGYDDSNMILFDRFDFDDLGQQIDSMTDADISRMREAALAVTWERHMWRHRLEWIARTVLK